MKKISLYTSYLFALLFIFSGCSSEDVIVPGNVPFVDPFLIPADKTDAESVLRRGFYERTGIHLILRDEVGQTLDAEGNPYTEMIDLEWNLTGESSPENYTLLSPDEQAKAVEALEKYIVPHLCGEGSSLFAIYPVADYYDRYGDSEVIFSNVRCTLINMKDILAADDEDELAASINTTLLAIATAMIKELSYEDREPFYDFSEEYHSEYISDYIPEWLDDQDITYVYEYGFVNYYKDRWGEVDYDAFPSYSNDFSQFIEFTVKNSEDEVNAKFADYPLVIAKYQLMRSLITKAGYVF